MIFIMLFVVYNMMSFVSRGSGGLRWFFSEKPVFGPGLADGDETMVGLCSAGLRCSGGRSWTTEGREGNEEGRKWPQRGEETRKYSFVLRG